MNGYFSETVMRFGIKFSISMQRKFLNGSETVLKRFQNCSETVGVWFFWDVSKCQQSLVLVFHVPVKRLLA